MCHSIMLLLYKQIALELSFNYITNFSNNPMSVYVIIRSLITFKQSIAQYSKVESSIRNLIACENSPPRKSSPCPLSNQPTVFLSYHVLEHKFRKGSKTPVQISRGCQRREITFDPTDSAGVAPRSGRKRKKSQSDGRFIGKPRWWRVWVGGDVEKRS